MPDNIFGINVGQVDAPSIGGGRGLGSSGGGSPLNSLIKFQQKMAEMEFEKQKQEEANKNFLFNSIYKDRGLGFKNENEFLGFSPANQYEATQIKNAQKAIDDEIVALSKNPSRENYAQAVSNIQYALHNEDLLAARMGNKKVSDALKYIDENKINVHPLYTRELQKYQNATNLSGYNLPVLTDPNKYKVTPVNVDADIKEFDKMGLSFRNGVIGGHNVIITTKDNHNQISEYVKGKYGNNLALDWELEKQDGTPTYNELMSMYGDEDSAKEQYIADKSNEMASHYAVNEDSLGVSHDLGKTQEQQKWESDLDISKQKQIQEDRLKADKELEAYKTAQQAIRQGNQVFAPSGSSKSGGTGQISRKNPFTTSNAIAKDIYDRLDKAEIINNDNDIAIQREISELQKKLKKEGATEEKIKSAVDKIIFKHAPSVGNTERNFFIKDESFKNGTSGISVNTLSGNEIDLDEYAGKEVEGDYKFGQYQVPTGFGKSPTHPGFGFKKEKYKTSTRFVPEKYLDGANYGGYIYTNNPNIYSKEQVNINDSDMIEISSDEANKIFGKGSFIDGKPVYKIPATVDQNAGGLYGGEKSDDSEIIGFMESDGNYDAKNPDPDSSASGKYQFIDETGLAIAQNLGLAKDMAEYKEKMFNPDMEERKKFQDALFQEQNIYLEKEANVLQNKLDELGLYDTAQNRISEAIRGDDSLLEVPRYMLKYLIHHQGSAQGALKYIVNGPQGVKDGYGLEKVLRKGFKKYRYGKFENNDEAMASRRAKEKPSLWPNSNPSKEPVDTNYVTPKGKSTPPEAPQTPETDSIINFN